jgi:hypothetical protein
MVNVHVELYGAVFMAFSALSIMSILFLMGSRGKNPELEAFAVIILLGCVVAQITVIAIALANSVI